MGFIEEIERKRQQEIQQDLIRKAELEKKQQLEIQNAAEQQEKAEGDAVSFIRDRSSMAILFDRMIEWGYKGYFEDVSRISGLELKQSFYAKYYAAHEFSRANPELVRQHLNAQKELEDASSRFGWSGLREQTDPNVVFFKDKVTTVEEGNLTEPKGLGVGIRFLKKAVRTDSHRNRLSEFFGMSYSFPIEKWDHAVYVRIDPQSRATITGFTQHQVDLKDLRLFDQLLYQAIHDPAIIHTTRMERWEPPSRSSSSGGASYSDTHGDTN